MNSELSTRLRAELTGTDWMKCKIFVTFRVAKELKLALENTPLAAVFIT
jgi:hypothetical protein